MKRPLKGATTLAGGIWGFSRAGNSLKERGDEKDKLGNPGEGEGRQHF